MRERRDDKTVEKIKELIEAGYSRSLTAEKLGLSLGVVSGVIHRHKIKGMSTKVKPRQPSDIWTDLNLDRLKGMLKAGHTFKFIAQKLGMNPKTVSAKAKDLGLRTTNIQVRPPKRKSSYPPLPRLVLPPEVPPDPAKTIPLVDATSKHCRWPVDEPSAEMLVCGCRPAEGLPYCAFHFRKSLRSKSEELQDKEDAFRRKFKLTGY